MIFEINGMNIVPYIAEDGIEWTANGVDGPDAGRVLSADMERDLIAYKASAKISCVWMKKETAVRLHQKIMPEYVTVRTDTIPWISGVVTKTMYSNNISSRLIQEYTDGTQEYGDLSFPLIER